MAINRVSVFNAKPVKASSIEKNPFFQNNQKKTVERNIKAAQTQTDNNVPKHGSKIDVTG